MYITERNAIFVLVNTEYMAAKVVTIPLPEYQIDHQPEYVMLGKRVDAIIGKNFPDGTYILRAISSQDHPQLGLDQLADVIIQGGTDKYDPQREGVCHDEFTGYDYDIQAGTLQIKNHQLVVTKDDKYPSVFGSIMYLFYEHAPLDRGYSLRIDLLMLYDPKKLVRARKFHPQAKSVRKGLNNFLYKFREPNNKASALLGIVKIPS